MNFQIQLICLIVFCYVFGVFSLRRCVYRDKSSKKFLHRAIGYQCFTLITEEKTWSNAEEFCKTLADDSFLADVSTMSDLNWISTFINALQNRFQSYNVTDDLWIGGKKSGKAWRWSSTKSIVDMSSPPWAEGRPNGTGNGIALHFEGNNVWSLFDRHRNSKLHSVCEFRSSKWKPARWF